MRRFIIMAAAFLIGTGLLASEGHEKKELFKEMGKRDKGAVVMVHFGTTYPETRAQTIDAINQKAEKEFPGIDVKEAYTSRIIMRKLNERGQKKNNPVEVFEKLKAEGYTHILVQSTNIINGIEASNLEKEVEKYGKDFKEIRLGAPLLTTPTDYKEVAHAIGERIGETDKDQAVVLVGHGTHDAANASYPMMDYVLKAEGYDNYHLGTVEGYPGMKEVLVKLEETKVKKVILMPFMFVAGDHANNDIAVDWKEELEKKGYNVEVIIEGLGQNKKVQDLYMKHAKFTAGHKEESIAEKKEKYAAGQED